VWQTPPGHIVEIRHHFERRPTSDWTRKLGGTVKPVDEVQMSEALYVVERLSVLTEAFHTPGAALSADRLDRRPPRLVMRAVDEDDWLQREPL
jgi:hypothetical protein